MNEQDIQDSLYELAFFSTTVVHKSWIEEIEEYIPVQELRETFPQSFLEC